MSRYQNRLLTSMTHTVGNAEDAEDVVQEAFVQAYLKLHSFRADSRFYTWLYRIAFRVAVTRQRTARPTVSIDEAREDQGAEPLDRGAGPGDAMLQAERVSLIQQALQAIPEEFRVVLVLRELEDCDYEQMAEILELSPGTVRSRLHRARARLREQIERMRQQQSEL